MKVNTIMKQERDDQLQQIAEKCKESTVYLKTTFLGPKIGTGSAFFVEPDKIVTNIHVINGYPGYKVKVITAKQLENKRIPIRHRISDAVKNSIFRLFQRFFIDLRLEKNVKPNQSQNREERVKYTIEGVTAFDERNDLVLLKITETGVPLPIGNNNVLQSSEKVFIVGYSDTQYEGIEGNIVNANNSEKQLMIKVKKPNKDIEGHSGGPVLNSKGEVIGVAESVVGSGSNKSDASDHCFVHAVPVNDLKEMMENSGQVEPLEIWRKHPQIRAYNTADLGNMKLAAGKYKQAIEYYTAALQRNPNFAFVYFKRGYAKDELGDLKGAIEDYDNAIKLSPDNAGIYNNRGYSKNKLGDYESAIEDYDNAIRHNPEDVVFYNNRGRAKKALGQHEAAEADFTKAKELASGVKQK